MKKIAITGLFLAGFLAGPLPLPAREGTVPRFSLEPNDLMLSRIARPGAPFDRCGRRFALLGEEGGSFEAWAWPLKLVRDFRLSFFTGESTRPIQAHEIVRRIEVTPESAVLTFIFQSFTVRAVYLTSLHKPGALILLDVDSSGPLTIVGGFLPVLEPMWPAGIGGQHAGWDSSLKAYVISEPTRRNHAVVGSPAAAGMSYTPAHMLSDMPSEFRIEIPEPESVRGRFIPIGLAGGMGEREPVIAAYRELLADPEAVYRENLAHYRRLRERTLRIHTPAPRLDLAFEWAKSAFDNLIVDHPDMGRGMVAGLGASGTSGRPGFGWFFSGDACINSLSLLGYGAHADVRDILAFIQKWQREDGKMAHELSMADGYVDWWKDYPYGYIHGDTTPWYICAMDEYVRWTGDREFLRESWPSVKKAYAWCRSTDENRDGLMDNRRAGLGALEYGALTGIESDIYISAIWLRAADAMGRLAAAAGDSALTGEADSLRREIRSAFDEKFWDPEAHFHAYAFDRDGRRVREISPWNAVGLMWGLGDPERSRDSLRRLGAADLITDWGVRSISERSTYYQALNYNYGAVWPFLTSWVTSALYSHRMPLQAFPLLKSTAELTFVHGLGSLTEVFSGDRFTWPEEAVSHQGFSTAAVTLPLVRGLLGLDGDAGSKTVTFSPRPPGDWDSMRIEDLRVGQSRFDIGWHRADRLLSIEISPDNAELFTARVRPALAAGTEVTSVTLDSDPIEFDQRHFPQVIEIETEFLLDDAPRRLEIELIPTVEILPCLLDARPGDRSRGLRILSVDRKGSRFEIQVEGLAGESYFLGIRRPEHITRVSGGELQGDLIRLRIPESPAGGFCRHRIAIQVQRE